MQIDVAKIPPVVPIGTIGTTFGATREVDMKFTFSPKVVPIAHKTGNSREVLNMGYWHYFWCYP